MASSGGTAVSRASWTDRTATRISMIGLAMRPGTAVLPKCSIDETNPAGKTACMRSASAAYNSGHLGSYSTMRTSSICVPAEGFAAVQTGSEAKRGDEGAGVGEEIAVGRIEGKALFVGEVHANAGSLVARCCGGNSTEGVDGCGHSCVGGTKNPAMVFDGAHTDHIEVLPCGAGVAVPAVVGDVDQDIGPLLGEMADFVAKDRFVADEDAVDVAARSED